MRERDGSPAAIRSNLNLSRASNASQIYRIYREYGFDGPRIGVCPTGQRRLRGALLARENHRKLRDDGFEYERSAVANPEASPFGQIIAAANEQGGGGNSIAALSFCRESLKGGHSVAAPDLVVRQAARLSR
jgi:hypothetical protein